MVRQLGVVIPADFAVIADSAGIRCFFNEVQHALLTLYLRLCYGVATGLLYYGEE